MTVAVIYLYSVVLFYKFDDMCTSDANSPFLFYGQEMYVVFWNTFYYGLTLGGGVGDALN